MPQTIGFDISVEIALEIMKEYACHHLPVLDGGKLVDILSDRDLSMARHDSNGVKAEHLVKDLMSDAPIVIEPSAEINTAIWTMLDNKINSIIVRVEGGMGIEKINALFHKNQMYRETVWSST